MWATVNVTSKFFYLLGSAAVIGGLPGYFLLRGFDRQLLTKVFLYMALGALVGALASVCYFLAQVGAINDAGVRGMFDWSMAGMLMDTNLGTGSFYRILAFLVAILGWLVVLYDSRDERLSMSNPLMILALLILSGGLFAWSTTLTGHVSTLDVGTRIVLCVHLLAVCAWIGSLWPLRTICNSSDVDTVTLIMERYGKIAVFVVAALVLSGLWMVLQLLNEPQEIVTTTYGRVLALKLIAVTGIVAIAARHKFSLVPGLNEANGMQRLQKSIDREISVALLIVIVTAVLTTVIGPEMDH